jgi:hypothetical protein
VSHRLRGQLLSPSAPSATYLWGRGPIGHALGSYLRSAEVDDRNKIAQALAVEHGCPVGTIEGTWAVSITDAIDHCEFDALTRDDPAVMGWTEDRNATCAASVALRNALNSLTPAERDQIMSVVASPFLRPDVSPDEIRTSHDLVARDGRHVVFDGSLSEWRLGEYATT